MSAFYREAFKACLYGYADKQQQQSVASALILANGLKFDLANALQEQIDECFDDRCEMCLRHEAVIAKALGSSQTPSSSSLHTPVEDRGRDGLVSVKSEHRLSGERPRHARADHAAGSRSSDGSDAISATDASHASSSSPAGAVRGAASANQDDVA